MKLTSSPKLNILLYQMGIVTPYQVVCHLPRRYDSFVYTPKEDLELLEDKQRLVVYGKIVGQVKTLRFKNLINTKFYFEDEFGNQYQVVAWNRSYLSTMLNHEDSFTLQATFDHKKHELNLLNIKKGRIDPEHSIVPVYTLPREYPTHAFRALVEKSLNSLSGEIYDRIPPKFREKYRFVNRFDALKKCHMPSSMEDVRQGLRVLKYEEALLFALNAQIMRGQNRAYTKDTSRVINRQKVRDFVHSLPYGLTGDQKNVIAEALRDMESPSCMYRLLQGDVGTGKTLVSALLMYANFTRAEQSALMAPTDALARQHYETLCKLFEGTGVRVRLLVGNMTPQDRRYAMEDIEDGTADIIVGTHALFSKGVEYAYLGLVIIDEQHKFGVNQRALLANKGEHADVLLMSATPIPRTLSLTIYGDLDVSTLTEFPSVKRNVKTVIARSSAKAIDKQINASLEENARVFIVAPQIDGNEEDELSSAKKVFKAYDAKYPGRVALLHGKLDDGEKEAALLAFKTGLCPILVATSVIEVGIDVKEANLMIIYDATHFALSSLHQLRGRVGRDGRESICVLVYDGKDEEELEKLKVLTSTEDGFKIAEEDLKRRGPGTIVGTRQSGLPDFRFVNVIDDFKMFECARDDATYILNNPKEPGFAYLISEARKKAEGLTLA
ncbi:MAG: ATP-dependent DNA helicase RecG [Bacilli bacterium]|nr:ATP-dependent DNA helicase RecG [Bacilli bacterium]